MFRGAIIRLALVVVALLGFLRSEVAFSQVGFNPVQQVIFQKALDDGVATCLVPGAVAAVRSPQGAVWKGAAGWANLATKDPMSLDLHLHIGSLTKSFTAILFMQLVDEKKATLDDTVEKWLPGLLKSGDQITIRDLLQMRSGLPRYESSPVFGERFIAQPRYQWTPKELAALCDQQIDPPGSRFYYSNINYFLVGMIIEKALGQPFNEVISNRIFSTLPMLNTSFPHTADMPEPFAHGYLNENGRATDVSTRWDPSAFWAAGSIISTLEDMLIYASALFEGSLTSSAAHKEQFSFVPVGSDPSLGYGMGVGDNHGMVGHNGNYNGLYTASIMELKGYYIIILSNGQASGGGGGSDAPCVLSKFREIIENLPR
jgi:D-alanyl-D-alanine carboxypeptidase